MSVLMFGTKYAGTYRSADGSLPYGPGTKLVYPNGATYIVDYQNNLRYYGWDFKDPSAIPVTYDVLIKYNKVNSEGWFGRKITSTDPLIVDAPSTVLQQQQAAENTQQVATKSESPSVTQPAAAASGIGKYWPVLAVIGIGILGFFAFKKFKKG